MVEMWTVNIYSQKTLPYTEMDIEKEWQKSLGRKSCKMIQSET